MTDQDPAPGPSGDERNWLSVDGTELVTGDGSVVRLRGVGLGGWMNMENFITGYPSTETAMRTAVGRVLGEDRAALYFERLLTVFFDEPDATLVAELGMNCVRLPVNYRHFEDDAEPFTITVDGFRHLDRAIDLCARHGLYTVIDLHALPGYQNHHWHSDNPTHLPGYWAHPHFRDRVVHLWQALAERYRGNPMVAGYNLINEPADEGGQTLVRHYARLARAVREVDPHHVLFLDGNTYGTEFSGFGEPLDNAVYAVHDYTVAGFADGGDYPGRSGGNWIDKEQLRAKFRERTDYQRRTGTPIWVGEFGPVFVADTDRDRERYQILEDQLDIYAEHGASWSVWTYKDIGVQGIVSTRPDTPYQQRFADLIAKKARLGVDSWGSTRTGIRAVMEPIHELIARELPAFDPYPFGARKFAEDLVRHILLAQAMVGEYAEAFRDLDDDELLALADSFALGNCVRRDRLCDVLRDAARKPATRLAG